MGTPSILLHQNGRQRVVISKRDDGFFSYQAERLVPVYTDEMAERLDDYSKQWVPDGGPATICETLEIAEREAAALLGSFSV